MDFSAPVDTAYAESTTIVGSGQTSQQEVWETVHAAADETETATHTRSLGDVYASTGEERCAYEDALGLPKKTKGLVGCLFVVGAAEGGAVHVALDLFGRQELFETFFPGLRASAALTALRLARRHGEPPRALHRTEAQRLARNLLAAVSRIGVAQEGVPGSAGTLWTGGTKDDGRLAILDYEGQPLHVLFRHAPRQ